MKSPARQTPKTPRKQAKPASPEPDNQATAEIVRRKTDDQRKENQLHIRLTDAQKVAMTQAAAREGLELSPWVRATLLRAAGLLPT